MRPVLIIIGLVIGALIGAKLATMFGGDYLAGQSYESPDEQSSQYQMVFLGGAALFAVIGGLLGWVISLLFGEKESES